MVAGSIPAIPTIMVNMEGHKEAEVKADRFVPVYWITRKDSTSGVFILDTLMGFYENSYKSFAFLKDGGMRVYKKQIGTETAKAGLVLVSLLRQDPLGQKLTEAGYTVLESRRCYRCQRLLTDPVSIEAGMGPECRSK